MRETEGRDSCGNLIPPLLSSDGHGQPAASFFYQKQSHKCHSWVEKEKSHWGHLLLLLGTQLVPLTSFYKVAHLALLQKGCRLLSGGLGWTGPQGNGTSQSGSPVLRQRWVAQCEGLWMDLR